MLQLQRTSGRRQDRVCKSLFCMEVQCLCLFKLLLVSDDVQALLDTGLTSHGKVQSAQRSLSLQQVTSCQPQQHSVFFPHAPHSNLQVTALLQDVASAMCRMHARKAAAAAVSRKVRCDMASMLQQHGAGPPGPIGSGQPSQELFAAVQKLGMATQRELAVMW